jgi:hypothetical protein
MQSLETLLRYYLYRANASDEQKSFAPSLSTFKVGMVVDESHLTQWAQFSWIVDAYNKDVISRDPNYTIDENIKSLRNLLFHGITTSKEMGGIPTLVKIKTIPGNIHVVEHAIEITDEWLRDRIGFVLAQWETAKNALLKFFPGFATYSEPLPNGGGTP